MNLDRLDLGSLRNAIASLEGALSVVADEAWLAAQSADMRNTLIAGVIQNFEFVYELSVKMIRRELEREADTQGETDRLNFRDLIRVAAEKGLIEDVDRWFAHRQTRNLTSHTYDHAKAWQAYQQTVPFIDDARTLLAGLETRNA
jgi:nucleotidyltransferase substrate binding protein (TIGR01987 family)